MSTKKTGNKCDPVLKEEHFKRKKTGKFHETSTSKDQDRKMNKGKMDSKRVK